TVLEQTATQDLPMVPLYAARIECPGDFGRFECAACGHDALVRPGSLSGCRPQPAPTRQIDSTLALRLYRLPPV
ncbi:MAG TPA: hypothetical protein VHL34_23845, partial [Rhizomicrobium sp.]|nr:hypothetical protein [Rhizomicrobium sp.]